MQTALYAAHDSAIEWRNVPFKIACIRHNVTKSAWRNHIDASVNITQMHVLRRLGYTIPYINQSGIGLKARILVSFCLYLSYTFIRLLSPSSMCLVAQHAFSPFILRLSCMQRYICVRCWALSTKHSIRFHLCDPEIVVPFRKCIYGVGLLQSAKAWPWVEGAVCFITKWTSQKGKFHSRQKRKPHLSAGCDEG
jgi:hypothetical protein